MKIRSLVLATLVAALAPGCGNLDNSESDDAELTPAGGKADSASSTSTYYTVRQDVRKCAWPACGQYWVKRANFSTTTCQDGVKRAECYVVDFDVENGLGLSSDEASAFRSQARAGQVILRGSIKPATYGTQTLGFFEPTEGYAAATADAPSGTFYRASRSGVRVHEAKLDSTISRNVSGVDLSAVAATSDQLTAADAELAAGDLIVAGSNAGPTLDATQFYLRVRHQAPADTSCGGFIGKSCPDGQTCDITIENACAGADLPGTCKPTPQLCYDIYQPVCGCDGKTYGNDCNRLAAGVQLDHKGACN
ncbi:MAG TPA: Kazal-type serine protease inhibitor family protein [Polyangia bacterium]|nr:Kazal-type serine protease inhibitor family protein [Polyangia bacterium]